LRDVLGRPRNARATMILVTGYPAEDALVPAITRKPFGEICEFI
jgi:iodotyrosine deiodinase